MEQTATETAFTPPEKELKTDLPVPLLWRILVQPHKMKNMTDGGIALPDDYIDHTKYLTMVGRIISMGNFAFQAKTSSGLDFAQEHSAPKAGNWVLYGKYAGQRIVMSDKREYIILNDDEIIAVVDDPNQYMHYA